ncbi:MAG: neutral ceramidase, partial [Pseudonocardiales bacterium]|nr:neutral ceramidase [Pseudonocardiales bacterium]
MADDEYLVGRGIADVTGEPAGVGMLGYGKADQRTEGIHTRLRARAFIFAEPGAGDEPDAGPDAAFGDAPDVGTG